MYSMTLYIYPSPFGVNWQSPHHLTRSVVLNAASQLPRQIGHVSVELISENPQKQERHFTGMTSNNNAINRRLIIWEGKGLGVLFYQYDGFLESPEKLDPEKEKRLQKGNFSFVRFELSEQSYERVSRYLTEYRDQNIGKYYGLPHRPRHGEGAGCSAFAASFLEVAGVMTDEFRKNWSSQVRVPEALMDKTPIWKLLIPSSLNRRWAHDHEPGRNIFFWDPDMMHSWVNRKLAQLEQEKSEEFEPIFEKNTRGILVRSSKIEPSDEPIWLHSSGNVK